MSSAECFTNTARSGVDTYPLCMYEAPDAFGCVRMGQTAERHRVAQEQWGKVVAACVVRVPAMCRGRQAETSRTFSMSLRFLACWASLACF